jgi:5-methylcytosine-specific restriction endonuclease McrA
MRTYSLTHLGDRELLRDLATLVARDRQTTALLLAHVAEVDERRLYLPAAYPSMHAYCVKELRLSEDAAYKRITAARLARQFPAIFEAIADGRLHLSAVMTLAPYLKHENADELLRAAAHKTRSELERLLAERYPTSELLPIVEVVPASSCQLAPGRVSFSGAEHSGAPAVESGTADAPARVECVAPQRFALHVSIGESTRDKLHRAQELLGHQLPTGDIAAVLDRALDALLEQCERQKFAATSRPQRKPRATASARHIPARVRRAVRERDGDQCTFVSEAGRRCEARTRLEFDHIEPVARGGESTVANLRLRCSAHNQFAAECEFGSEFMRGKRAAARDAAAARARAKAAAPARSSTAATPAASAGMALTQPEATADVSPAHDVVPWLRQLGYRAAEAREAARFCESAPNAPLEDRVRLALSYFRPRATGGRYASSGG